MPTINQLVRKPRQSKVVKSKSPASVSYTHLDVYKRQGYCNGKQLLKRLELFGITLEELEEAMSNY